MLNRINMVCIYVPATYPCFNTSPFFFLKTLNLYMAWDTDLRESRGMNGAYDVYVYDGSLYQSKYGPGGFLSKQYNLSLKLNTDGVAIFHSSQFGVWPLFFLVNELPPSLRYVFKIECSVQCQCVCVKVWLCLLYSLSFEVTVYVWVDYSPHVFAESVEREAFIYLLASSSMSSSKKNFAFARWNACGLFKGWFFLLVFWPF